MDYEFTLKYKLSSGESDPDQLIERLGDSGCEDALVGIGTPGRIALAFTRGAASAKNAIGSAIADVKRAIPCADLIEVGPDFVGLTDVAKIAGVSRQNIRKLMLAHHATFPSAIHEGSASIWHLALVMEWLRSRGGYPFDKATFDVASTAMHINITLDAKLVPPQVHDELQALVA